MGKFNEHAQVAKEYGVGGGGSTNFWRPEKGDNRVRILSEFEAYGNHWVPAEKRSYVCIGLEKGCPQCVEGDKPKAQFLMWVMDRNDNNNVKLAQIGYSVIKGIGDLANSADWGFKDMPEYDIVITKSSEGLKTEYAVTPTPNKTELTDVEKELVASSTKPLEEIIKAMKEKIIPVETEGASDNVPTTTVEEVEKSLEQGKAF